MEFKYLIIAAGTILLALIIFQVLSGLGKLRFDPKIHKNIGILLLVLSLIHALIAVIYLLG